MSDKSFLVMPSLKTAGLGLGLGFAATVTLESIMRRKAPDSQWRPTNALTLATQKSRGACQWLGYQLGRVTDVCYFVQEYFPSEDIKEVGLQTGKLVCSPFWALKGWHDYYTQEMSRLEYGLVSGVVVSTSLGLVYYKFGNQMNFESVRQLPVGLLGTLRLKSN